MSKSIRKMVKLCKKYGFITSKHVAHGTRYYNNQGQFVQIASSPRTEAFINDVKQTIARHLSVAKISIT